MKYFFLCKKAVRFALGAISGNTTLITTARAGWVPARANG
jgi:hypothetical protein